MKSVPDPFELRDRLRPEAGPGGPAGERRSNADFSATPTSSPGKEVGPAFPSLTRCDPSDLADRSGGGIGLESLADVIFALAGWDRRRAAAAAGPGDPSGPNRRDRTAAERNADRHRSGGLLGSRARCPGLVGFAPSGRIVVASSEKSRLFSPRGGIDRRRMRVAAGVNAVPSRKRVSLNVMAIEC